MKKKLRVRIALLSRNSTVDGLQDVQGLAPARVFGRGRSAAEPGAA